MLNSCRYGRLWENGIIADILMYFDKWYVQSAFLHPMNKSLDCIPHTVSTIRKVRKRAVEISDMALPFYVGLGIIVGIGLLFLALELCCT
jgi:hypothetical protein